MKEEIGDRRSYYIGDIYSQRQVDCFRLIGVQISVLTDGTVE